MMEGHQIHNIKEEEDKTHLTAIDPHFISSFGLHEHNALKYFSTSVFYDNKSLNALADMQRLDLEKVSNNPGKLYKVYKCENSVDKKRDIPHQLILIGKYQIDPSNIENPEILTGMYYILDQVIYQAPLLSNVIKSRITKSVISIQEAFKEMEAFIKFDPIEGYDWNYEHPNASTFRKAKQEMSQTVEGGFTPEKLDNLLNVVQKQRQKRKMTPDFDSTTKRQKNT